MAKMLLTHSFEVKYSMVSGSPKNLGQAMLLRGLSRFFLYLLFGVVYFVLWWFFVVVFFLP